MKKILAPLLALGLYACGPEQAPAPQTVHYVSPSERRKMIQNEINEDPRAFVERHGNSDDVGTMRFDYAVGAAINRGFVLEDPVYNKLVDAIDSRYQGYVTCYAEYPEGARGQECRGKIEKLQNLHSDMNHRRERAKKRTRPLTDIPELRLYR